MSADGPNLLSVNPKTIGNQFNLMLTILCQARHQMVFTEYERGLGQVKAEPALRRRTLIHVSSGDPGLAERRGRCRATPTKCRK